MYQFEFKKNENGYDIVIYLSQDTEFAEDFKSNDKRIFSNQFQSFYRQIKKSYPNVLFKSVKVVLGGLILATIPISTIDVQAQTVESSQQVTQQTYTTKSGDSLWSIANHFNVSVNDLKLANELSSDTIPIGKQLIIPTKNLSTFNMLINYTVQPNDSLWLIANRFKVTVEDIRSVNNLKSDVLQIGTVLKIPQTVTTTPEVSQTMNYTVQPNDSLWLIANRFRVTVEDIRSVNNLKSDVLQIGTVLKVPHTATTTPEVSKTMNYIVQPNDSLWSIANRFKVTVDEIRSANNLKSDVLQIGTVLKIPQTVTTTPEASQTMNYTVQPNDSLWLIANRFKVTVDEIRSANNLKSDVLQIGTVLKIPQTVTTTPEVSQTINYTVQPNDSLWIIANRFNVSVEQIRTANNLKSDLLSIGQTLIIPQTNRIYNEETRDILYRVKTGDTIESIASSFKITPQRIMEANNLSSRSIINNQALIIPLSNYNFDSTIKPTTYIVQSGDDLWKISKRFAVSIDSIRQASNLRSDNLSIGQKLIIPTTIVSTDYNRTTLEWLVEAQYNMTPPSVFHDVTVRNTEYWAKATKEQIYYYSNPVNFVDDDIQKYQFLVLNYHPQIQNTQLNNFLKNKGVFDGHGATFNRAASMYNVSQIYLASHAMLETGNGTTALARGILVREVDGKPVTPRVVYNMYGINAFDINPNKHGAEFAYKQQWFTVEDAIIGGAKWISDNYINHPTHQQNTLYKMRWNPSSPGVHQYSTDVAWAYHQTFNIYSVLSLYQNIEYQFDIPTFNQYNRI